jgi:hypothetical protein
MSNPTINRWGLNLFWYRLWYNDKNNALIIHQDNLINKLILIYIHYGLLINTNFFVNKYWYLNYKITYNALNENWNLKYFRIVEYKNRVSNEEKSYKIRNKLKNIYYSKIWILRYQNWLMVNFYCFQPLTSKKNKKIRKSKEVGFYLSSNKKTKNLTTRYRMFLSYFCNYFFNTKPYYSF